MHYTLASNGRVFLALKWSVCATKKDISLHSIQRNIWKIQDGGCWHVRFIAFMTILLNRPYRSRRFIYFKASFSGQKHQGKIYKTQRNLVANLATNFWILVASAIILVALAIVLGAISCPAFGWRVIHDLCKLDDLRRIHVIYTLNANKITSPFVLPYLVYSVSEWCISMRWNWSSM